MDAVKAFNVEMLSMMEMKPPISRAKMMSITKAGIKAIKLYKHVVQIIEKFIKRCGPELKVPGLYVVDSIIRQSRHQFGEDKDVFGPRFLKNMTETFSSLYECPPDDKAKILRVLNLWQKNSVFGMDVIQPLLDLAAGSIPPVFENGSPAALLPSVSVPVTLDPPFSTTVFSEPANPAALPQVQIPAMLPQLNQVQNPAALPQFQNLETFPQTSQLQNLGTLPQTSQLQNPTPFPQQQNPASAPPLQNPAALAAVTQFLQSAQGLNLQQMLQTLQQGSANPQPAAPTEKKSSIAKVLLDRFDYDEEPDAVEEPAQEEAAPAVSAAVNLEALQQALQAHLLGQLSSQLLPNDQAAPQSMPAPQTVTGFVQEAGQTVPDLQVSHSQGPFEMMQTQNHGYVEADLPDVELESRQPRRDERESGYSKRSRSRSPKRRSSSHSRTSRSGSQSRRSRYRRSRSRSRERRRASPRRRGDDRRTNDRRGDDRRGDDRRGDDRRGDDRRMEDRRMEDRRMEDRRMEDRRMEDRRADDRLERERERKQRGLPSIKRETLTVCSRTLWIGQLDKKTQQQDVTSLIEEFGQIDSLNMIPPRGCAYIVMVHRQDAYTALNRLSRGSAKINHKPFKIAWAQNKGVNSRFKKYWDVDLGVSYIPWSKLKTAEIPALREGGTLDQDTIKPEWVTVLDDLLKPVRDSGGTPAGDGGEGAAGAAVGPQVPVVKIDVVRSPAPLTPAVTTPPHVHTAPDQTEVPSINPTNATKIQAESPRVLLPTSPPAGTLIGTGPGPLQHSAGPLPSFASPFLNNEPRPNMATMNTPGPNTHHPNSPQLNSPHPNMPNPNMPQPKEIQPNEPHPNMSHPNAPHPNMPQPNEPHPYVSNPNAPHPNMTNPNEPHPNEPHPNMPHPNAPHPNMTNPNEPHPNMPHPNAPHPNMPHPNMPHPNYPHPNMPHPNAPHPNMLHPNGPHPNMLHPNGPHPNMLHPNGPRPNMPPMRMPQPMVPQGPMFRERSPRTAGPMGLMGPQGPLGPPGRFRMPIRGPRPDFPHPRERFPHPREGFPHPREGFRPPRPRFPYSGPMEGEHWDQGPPMNDWPENGPNRGPEWFGEESPFRRGGLGRGGPRGRGHF